MNFKPKLRLSKNFRLYEFTRSATAARYKMPNQPREGCEVANMKALCRNVLEPARAIYGAPITITSGFRAVTLNRLIGGNPESQHLFGEAADIIIQDPSVITLATALSCRDDIPYDQMIYECRWRDGDWLEWIHISHKRQGSNRGERLTIARKGDDRVVKHGVYHPSEFFSESP